MGRFMQLTTQVSLKQNIKNLVADLSTADTSDFTAIPKSRTLLKYTCRKNFPSTYSVVQNFPPSQFPRWMKCSLNILRLQEELLQVTVYFSLISFLQMHLDYRNAEEYRNHCQLSPLSHSLLTKVSAEYFKNDFDRQLLRAHSPIKTHDYFSINSQ